MKDWIDLRLSVESMGHEMVQAFSKHSKEVEQAIKHACETYVSSGRLQRDIEDAVNKEISEEIRKYFSYGDGSKLIKNAVSSLGKKK